MVKKVGTRNDHQPFVNGKNCDLRYLIENKKKETFSDSYPGALDTCLENLDELKYNEVKEDSRISEFFLSPPDAESTREYFPFETFHEKVETKVTKFSAKLADETKLQGHITQGRRNRQACQAHGLSLIFENLGNYLPFPKL